MALLTCNVIIQQRFNKHRSLATGMSIIGWSLGNFCGAPLTELLLNQYGLRGTLALLGAIQAHRIPLALQFRSPRHLLQAHNSSKVHFCETESLPRLAIVNCCLVSCMFNDSKVGFFKFCNIFDTEV